MVTTAPIHRQPHRLNKEGPRGSSRQPLELIAGDAGRLTNTRQCRFSRADSSSLHAQADPRQALPASTQPRSYCSPPVGGASLTMAAWLCSKCCGSMMRGLALPRGAPVYSSEPNPVLASALVSQYPVLRNSRDPTSDQPRSSRRQIQISLTNVLQPNVLEALDLE